jgi:hypothetical protein
MEFLMLDVFILGMIVGGVLHSVVAPILAKWMWPRVKQASSPRD